MSSAFITAITSKDKRRERKRQKFEEVNVEKILKAFEHTKVTPDFSWREAVRGALKDAFSAGYDFGYENGREDAL